MIRHVVLFKLLNKDSENIKKVVDVLNSVGEKVGFLKSPEIGIDFMNLKRSYDIAFISSFIDREDLEKYQDHEAHKPIKQYMEEVCKSIISVDYEID